MPNKERQAETEVQATTNADCTNVKPPYSQTQCTTPVKFYCLCGSEIPEDDPYDGYCTDCGWRIQVLIATF